MTAKIIDSHVHILPDAFREQFEELLTRDHTFGSLFSNAKNSHTASVEELIDSMDQAGITTSIAVGYGWTDIDVARMSNDYLAEAASTYPGRVIPFCSVNPLWGDPAIVEMKRCHQLGARGVGELHPDSQGLLDAPIDQLAKFMDCAKELDMPVLIHGSEPVGHSYPGKGTATPEMLMTLVERFPNNKLIFAHFGGGLPFYALMPEVKKALSNCYFDSAAFPFLYEPTVFDIATKVAGSRSTIFASDFPLIKQTRAVTELKSAKLPNPLEDAVLYSNAAELFNL